MFDLDRLETAVCSDTINEKLFTKHCREYDLEPSLLNSIVTRKSDNIQFIVTGLSKRGRAAWVLVKKYDVNYTGPERPAMLVDIRKFSTFYEY
jgi:hypothetical protein